MRWAPGCRHRSGQEASVGRIDPRRGGDVGHVGSRDREEGVWERCCWCWPGWLSSRPCTRRATRGTGRAGAARGAGPRTGPPIIGHGVGDGRPKACGVHSRAVPTGGCTGVQRVNSADDLDADSRSRPSASDMRDIARSAAGAFKRSTPPSAPTRSRRLTKPVFVFACRHQLALTDIDHLGFWNSGMPLPKLLDLDIGRS